MPFHLRIGVLLFGARPASLPWQQCTHFEHRVQKPIIKVARCIAHFTGVGQCIAFQNVWIYTLRYAYMIFQIFPVCETAVAVVALAFSYSVHKRGATTVPVPSCSPLVLYPNWHIDAAALCLLSKVRSVASLSPRMLHASPTWRGFVPKALRR